MPSYDTTEFIIGLAVKSALDKALGGAAPVVTGYHRFHFQLLARAIQESNRDADIQKTLEAVRKNLGEMQAHGKRIVKAIPAKPEPPSIAAEDLLVPAKNKAFSKRCADFAKGVTNVLEALRAYATAAEDMVKRSNAELAKVEKGLDMHKARWPAMRKISNAKRYEDIQFIKLQELSALSKQLGAVRSLIAAYDDI
jgi:hypothetical protein